MQADPESKPPPRRPPYGIYAYTAREWDPEINLYYYRARYYDPNIGRFISEDPIGLRGGLNLYSYVRNSPGGRIDPHGLCACDDPCPSGRWLLDTTISFTFGLLTAQSWGFGRLVCEDAKHVTRWAKIGCVVNGPFAALNLGGSLQFRGTTYTGICRPEDLPTKRVYMYTVSYGPFGHGGSSEKPDVDSVSISLGTSAGGALGDCYVHPL